MPATPLDALRAEVGALREVLAGATKKTVRDEALRDRFRNLFRSWSWTVGPGIEPFVQGKRAVVKLHAELEAIAKLASKRAKVTEYQKRLRRAAELADQIVLELPPSQGAQGRPAPGGTQELFVAGIPDLPVTLVPNALLGWRTNIEEFLTRYPFDKSVFIMMRYRPRNERLVGEVKKALLRRGYRGILASDHKVTDDLYNPIACLLCCSKGVAVFDKPEAKQVFNPNVAYELGMFHLLGRDCLILKHESLKALLTDVLMKLYHSYTGVTDVRAHLSQWLDGL